jgi:hypothetical protein
MYSSFNCASLTNCIGNITVFSASEISSRREVGTDAESQVICKTSFSATKLGIIINIIQENMKLFVRKMQMLRAVCEAVKPGELTSVVTLGCF